MAAFGAGQFAFLPMLFEFSRIRRLVDGVHECFPKDDR